MDGPTYRFVKSEIKKYSLSNGYSEILIPDELTYISQKEQISRKSHIIKLHPFSFVTSHISFAYEKGIKEKISLDIEVGYINSSINGKDIFGDNGIITARGGYDGFYLKPGIKFLQKGGGKYIRLDLATSFINYKSLNSNIYNHSPNNFTISTATSDIKSLAYGGFINFGKQYVFEDVIILEFYFGAGFTMQSNTYTNSSYLFILEKNGYQVYDVAKSIKNYYGFSRMYEFGLSFTAGLRLGFIIPNKKKLPKKQIS